MNCTCREICGIIDEIAPPELAQEGDPVGLHLGCGDQPVDRLFLALELTPEVLREALDFGADMILVHHTPFYRPFTHLREDEPLNRLVLELIRRRVALFCAHTNLDSVWGGVSDALARALDLMDVDVLQRDQRPAGRALPDTPEAPGSSLTSDSPGARQAAAAGLGRVGTLPEPMALHDFAVFVSKKLGASGLRYCGDGARQVSRVACCGGAGAVLLPEAIASGADAFVTADLKHHEGVLALGLGVALVDAGHFATENLVLADIAARIRKKRPQLLVELSAADGNPFIPV